MKEDSGLTIRVLLLTKLTFTGEGGAEYIPLTHAASQSLKGTSLLVKLQAPDRVRHGEEPHVQNWQCN